VIKVRAEGKAPKIGASEGSTQPPDPFHARTTLPRIVVLLHLASALSVYHDARPRVRNAKRKEGPGPKQNKRKVSAEGAARVVAAAIIAQLRGGPSPVAYKGAGSCYVEFGQGQLGRVDVDFLSGPKPTGTFQEPCEAFVAEKANFGSSRIQRWFGQPP
jgi:hypothetical protein